MMAQDDKPATLQVANSEPQKTYTVIIFEDGTRAIYEGKLTNEAVSYTHLDVYKRQLYEGQQRPHLRRQGLRTQARHAACLLYTSRCV